MKRSDRVSSIFWLVFGALWVFVATRLPLGNIRNPGPGFYPLLLGLLLFSFASALLLQTGRKGASNDEEERIFSGKGRLWLGVVSVTAALIIYGAFLQLLGFVLSTFLFMGFLFSSVGKQRWPVVLIGSLLATIGAYLIFAVFLDTQFPRGFIWL